MARIRELWNGLYPGEETVLGELLSYLEGAHTSSTFGSREPFDCDGSVYCLYPDSFDGGLDGATAHMDYFADLGVKTLWVLPVLSSPGRDQGFDISDYRTVDARFGGNDAFFRFLAAAKAHGLQTVFDVAINHCSDRHRWFQDAVSLPDSPYRDYFIWSDTDTRYAAAPLVFRGMVDSNWTWNEAAGAYYFHRFYPFQPDLNYANPRVTAEMIKILGDWKLAGVGGFRMDAAVMLWKREGTDCENLPETHLILKLFRAALDAIEPGSLLLAEANQPVAGILPFFGEGDECRAAYHFPLMPRFWQAMAEESPRRLIEAEVPPLPEGCAWFTFVRVHDEITLDVLPDDERAALVTAMSGKKNRLFRQGSAFSGRLFDLLGRNPDRAIGAFALLFSLPGTPVLYYGDEIAMIDNEAYYEKTAAETGFPDSRFLHRGPFDSARGARATADPASPEGQVLRAVRELFRLRSAQPALFAARPELSASGAALVSRRRADGKTLTIIVNLSGREIKAEGFGLKAYGSAWSVKGD
ncbi:MAG: alpha-amylase family glycosyl hydrolase [Treponemataceae bacterium]